ncbi:DEKNAAC102710 [Brettanomyces naardenensis]|uniref:DEKNAAC102710 n=1 Tax=Brettanomyces naardenensis TaxID=13370 RepID=A0A448YKZ2_BRENA|nr:DEKNAAC102710 [Brettanomyces naardenensis]
MSNYTLEKFLEQVKQAIYTHTLDKSLSVNPVTTKHIPLLQPILQDYKNKQLDSIIENYHFFNNDWPAFEILLQKYLIYVRDFDPWSLLDSIDLLMDFYEANSIALNNKQFNSLLFKLTYEATKIMIPLSKLVDTKLMKVENRVNNYPRVSYLSTVMLKALNNLRSSPELDEKSGNPSTRYTIFVLMYVSISLCNVYIYIGSPILCNNVFSNINVLGLDRRLVSKSQLIKYRFVLGKFHLLQSHYFEAFHHFEWCFSNCHVGSGVRILVTILKYLIPCGLLVGKIVDTNILRAIAANDNEGQLLVELYTPLIEHYKAGDLSRFTECVKANRQYFINMSLLVGFLQRIRILILRNLFHNVYRMTNMLRFEDIRLALALSLNVNEQQQAGTQDLWFYLIADKVDDTLTENILMSLIDNNLIKAKLTASRNVILRKNDSFPKIYDIYRIMYPGNSKESWLD